MWTTCRPLHESGAASRPESALTRQPRPLWAISDDWIQRTMVETSYNGWEASRDPRAIMVDASFAPAGVRFPGGVKAGDVSLVLGYVATRIHATVEKLVPGWCWGYEYRKNLNDPSTLSTHASATSIDVNAPNHPNGAKGTFTSAQVDQIRRILAQAGGVVAWGHDWQGTTDEMHFEIRGSAREVSHAAAGLPSALQPPVKIHPFPLPLGYYFGPLSGPNESISGMAADRSDAKYRPDIARIQAVVDVRRDGLYGPLTIRAVTGWQAAHHLEADGLTGVRTWRAMRL
jgi:peptidoglycan hydrolase-like protein with peptidoglycan-binding domain